MHPLLIVLAAIGGILLLLLLILLFGRAKVRITYTDQVTVLLSILGYRKKLYPTKEEQEKKELVVSTDPKHILEEELREARKLRKKLRREQEKKAKKAAKKAAKASAIAKANATREPNLLENLACIFSVVREIYYRSRGKLKIKVHKMKIVIGTEDAAKTAILYGAILQSTAYILQWIQDHFNRLRRSDGDMQVIPDYTAYTSHAEVDIACSMTFLRILIIYVASMSAYETKKQSILAKRKKNTTFTDRISRLAGQ